MRHRTLTAALTIMFAILPLAACGGGPAASDTGTDAAGSTDAGSSSGTDAGAQSPADGANAVVVYFSATGNTAQAAAYLADLTGAATFELVPAEPYTDADLDYNDDNSRVVREHDDESLRDVKLADTAVPGWDDYDTVYLGYPIWWQQAAWPVNDFVTSNDFTGKTVIPFATSASSGLADSGTTLAALAGTGDWLDGVRFPSSVTEQDVRDWLDAQ